MPTLRPATDADAAVLGRLFTDAVRAAAPQVFSPEQVQAWAAAAQDPTAFGRRMLTYRVWLAEEDGEPVGFATLGADGHVGALFVRGDRQRRGIGRQLLRAVLEAARDEGLTRLYAEVNPMSRPVFEQLGFVVTGTERVARHGAWFERDLVACDVPPRGAS